MPKRPFGNGDGLFQLYQHHEISDDRAEHLKQKQKRIVQFW